MNDKGMKGMVTPNLASFLVNFFKPEIKNQFKKRSPNSNRLNDVLMNGNIPVFLYRNMLTFGDSSKSF